MKRILNTYFIFLLMFIGLLPAHGQTQKNEIGISLVSVSIPCRNYELVTDDLWNFNVVNQLSYRRHFKELSFRAHLGLEEFERAGTQLRDDFFEFEAAIVTQAIQLDLGVEVPFIRDKKLSPYLFGDLHTRIMQYIGKPTENSRIDAEGGQIGLMTGAGLSYGLGEHIRFRAECVIGIRLNKVVNEYSNSSDDLLTLTHTEFTAFASPLNRLSVSYAF